MSNQTAELEPLKNTSKISRRSSVRCDLSVASTYLVEVIVDSPISLKSFLDKHRCKSGQVSAVEPMIGLGLYTPRFK